MKIYLSATMTFMSSNIMHAVIQVFVRVLCDLISNT